jgi:hypothetical protein
MGIASCLLSPKFFKDLRAVILLSLRLSEWQIDLTQWSSASS